MTFGPLFFAAPAALLALLALPLLFLILRAAPPAPKRTFFPPLQLLLGLKTEEETKQRAPLWLVLLRALAAALMIVGFARPSLAPQVATATNGPTLIIIDDGWTSAPFWARIQAAAFDEIAEAERAHKELFFLTTAATLAPHEAGEAMSAGDARNRLAQMQPLPWRPDRADAQKRLVKAPKKFGKILWLSDGLDDPNVANFGKAVGALGPVTIRLPQRTAQAIVGAQGVAEGIEVNVKRAGGGAPAGAVAAETRQGRSLGAIAYKYQAGLDETRAVIKLPPEIASRRATRVRIVGETSAGAVRLMSPGTERPFVGLVDAGGEAQPLLSDVFYVERAIAPFATSRRGDVLGLIQQGAQAIVLPDASRLSPPERAGLKAWIENGGLLIRFAGPRLANDVDDLVPARLRPGARALGGAMAWETPQALADFPAESPFAGLVPPPDATINQQVLADPSAEQNAQVWARLQDGASIVTAAARGKGLIVLFHITAGPAWSQLPLTGLYVEMLRRTLSFAGRAQNATQANTSAAPWLPERLTDGFGALVQPGPDAKPIPAEIMANAKAGPATPPGLYTRAGSPPTTIDAVTPQEVLRAMNVPRGFYIADLGEARTKALSGIFLALAAFMIALDLLLSLFLAGKLPRIKLPTRAAATAAALALAIALAPPPRAHAAVPQGAATNTLATHLAYIKTGDPRRDRITQQGLAALSETLMRRTSVEPAEPVGVDPARDDLSPYPILYWAAPDAPHRLSDVAVANLDRYMRLGGLLFIDTRDAGRAAAGVGPAQIMLQGIDAPPLEPVGANHVLTRTFYLMQSFPGSSARTKIWAETPGAAAARDGVPALIIGNGDWASVWAQDVGYDDPLGGGRPRELALRFGVNLVMLALTGNYKADQVHVPALLERLGQSRRVGGDAQ